MKPRSPDTEPRAEEMVFDLLRKAGPARRLELSFQLSAMVWNGMRATIDRLHPEKTQDERDRIFMTEMYGAELAKNFIAYRQKVRGPMNQKVNEAEPAP